MTDTHEISGLRELEIAVNRELNKLARDDERRDLERVEQFAQARVFLRLPVFGEVAGREDDVGTRGEGVDAVDAAAQVLRRVDHVMQELALAADVRIGDLRDQHARFRKLTLSCVRDRS